VRELAQLSHTTPDEVSAIAELPAVVPTRRAPPRSRRAAPSPIDIQIMRLLLAHPRMILQLDAAAREVLARHPVPAMAALVEACEASPEGATLASLSEILLHGPEGDFFRELVKQVLDGAETDRETAESDLGAAVVKLRIQQIRAELDPLAERASSDPAAKARILELMEEQRRLVPDASRAT
jgi:DNA primase